MALENVPGILDAILGGLNSEDVSVAPEPAAFDPVELEKPPARTRKDKILTALQIAFEGLAARERAGDPSQAIQAILEPLRQDERERRRTQQREDLINLQQRQRSEDIARDVASRKEDIIRRGFERREDRQDRAAEIAAERRDRQRERESDLQIRKRERFEDALGNAARNPGLGSVPDAVMATGDAGEVYKWMIAQTRKEIPQRDLDKMANFKGQAIPELNRVRDGVRMGVQMLGRGASQEEMNAAIQAGAIMNPAQLDKEQADLRDLMEVWTTGMDPTAAAALEEFVFDRYNEAIAPLQEAFKILVQGPPQEAFGAQDVARRLTRQERIAERQRRFEQGALGTFSEDIEQFRGIK